MTVSVIVACHGGLASALKASAEMICGPLPHVVAVPLDPEDSPETFRSRLDAAIETVPGPVLVFADLVGGTPHNVASVALRGRPDAALVSGFGLGILVEAATALDVVTPTSIRVLLSRGREASGGWLLPEPGPMQLHEGRP